METQYVKIYVTNILPSNVNIDAFCKRFTHFCTKSKTEMYSLDFGIHVFQKDTIYRIEPSFKEHYTLIKDYNGVDLLIDENKEIHVPALSQLPCEYIVSKKKVYEFKETNKSNIAFIVEGVVQKSKETLDEIVIPVDFYFVCDKINFDIHNVFFQNEMNEFLSVFN